MTREQNDAINALLKGIKILIDEYTKNTTKIYTGRVTATTSTGTPWLCNVEVNGKTYNLPVYGGRSIYPPAIVKVFVPQGNMNVAFIM